MRPNKNNVKSVALILASNSPRRKELMHQIGLDFRVDPADVDESVLPGESPERYAVRVALDKARVAAARSGTGIVIAADTIVVLDEKILGKPAGPVDAERMLKLLSGNVHRVITGLAVMDAASGKALTRVSTTRVWFRNLALQEIISYVATGEPLDKAGAYAIQPFPTFASKSAFARASSRAKLNGIHDRLPRPIFRTIHSV